MMGGGWGGGEGAMAGLGSEVSQHYVEGKTVFMNIYIYIGSNSECKWVDVYTHKYRNIYLQIVIVYIYI